MGDNLQMSNQQFDPIARVLAANAMAQSLSFCTERKYLDAIDVYDSGFQIVGCLEKNISKEPYWIKISQIGKPLNDRIEDCFTAIQKIIHSCFLPYRSQLIFIVHNEKKIANLYLGIRPIGGDIINDSFAENLNQFIGGIWPGIQSEQVTDVDFLQRKMQRGSSSYNSIYSLTGIPSIEDQYKSTYPATIDKLIAGMHNEDFTYMVVADPIPENEIDSILYTCRDLNGQAESLKSFNFSENSTISKSLSKSISQKDLTTAKIKLLAMLGGTVSILGTAISAIKPELGAVGLGLTGIGGLLTSFIPQSTESETYSESQGKTISVNVVNKHIESISEHLFYHLSSSG